jgi:hypothetical protein
MVEEIGGLPAGALGLRITGKLRRDADPLDPALAWLSE